MIASIVSSVQEETHAQTEKGRKDSRGKEWFSKSPEKLQSMAIEGDKNAGDRIEL